MGGIIAGILLSVASIVEYMGYSAMKRSVSIGSEGQKGAGKLCVSMIVLLVAAIIDFFPLTGMIVGIISLVALCLVFRGWNIYLSGTALPKPSLTVWFKIVNVIIVIIQQIKPFVR